jgi:hypothetical protein
MHVKTRLSQPILSKIVDGNWLLVPDTFKAWEWSEFRGWNVFIGSIGRFDLWYSPSVKEMRCLRWFH